MPRWTNFLRDRPEREILPSGGKYFKTEVLREAGISTSAANRYEQTGNPGAQTLSAATSGPKISHEKRDPAGESKRPNDSAHQRWRGPSSLLPLFLHPQPDLDQATDGRYHMASRSR